MRAHAEADAEPAAAEPAARPSAIAAVAAPTGLAGASPASLLQLQRAYGNAAVGRMLAREERQARAARESRTELRVLARDTKKKLPDVLYTRGHGTVFVPPAPDGQDVDLRETPDESAAVAGQLKAGQSATLIGTAGDFYLIELDGKRYYAKQAGLGEAIDTPGAGLISGWDVKFQQMQDRLDKSGHAAAPAATTSGGGIGAAGSGAAISPAFMALQERLSASTTWDDDLEAAQTLLREYANWYWDVYHVTAMPGNLADFFKYIGRGTKNYVSAKAGGYATSGALGGTAGSGVKAANWCTQATSQAVLDAIGDPTNIAKITSINTQLIKARKYVGTPAAYSAPLQPGDMVMYLFGGCQYGGHTVTVVDDLGTSFTHVSGNSTNSAVMMGEAKRLTAPPAGFDIGKATPGPVYVKDSAGKDTSTVDQAATNAAHSAATAYIAGFNFGGGVLTYSIIRYGSFLEGVTAPKPQPKP
jgi:hypothetical protein